MTVFNQAAGSQLDVDAIQRAINALQAQIAASPQIASTPQVLAKSAVPVACPADTSEDVLATITIPAGAMGPNGALRISSNWTVTNSANNKSLRIRLGGIGGTQFLLQVLTGSIAVSDLRMIQNRGAANSQVGGPAQMPATTLSGTACVTSAVDTSVSTTLVITGQKALAGEVLTLESYLVELIYGA